MSITPRSASSQPLLATASSSIKLTTSCEGIESTRAGLSEELFDPLCWEADGVKEATRNTETALERTKVLLILLFLTMQWLVSISF